jgi:hypothetical protein
MLPAGERDGLFVFEDRPQPQEGTDRRPLKRANVEYERKGEVPMYDRAPALLKRPSATVAFNDAAAVAPAVMMAEQARLGDTLVGISCFLVSLIVFSASMDPYFSSSYFSSSYFLPLSFFPSGNGR